MKRKRKNLYILQLGPSLRFPHANYYCTVLKNWKIYQVVSKFQPFRPNGKKRTTSGGGLKFLNAFYRKLLFHLTSNTHFRTFWYALLVLGAQHFEAKKYLLHLKKDLVL